MGSEAAKKNDELVRRWIELTNERDYEGLREIWAEDLVLHQGPDVPDVLGFDGFVGILKAFYGGIPDLRVDVEDTVASDDTVIMRSMSTGTHTGELFGLPATGRSVRFAGVNTFRIADGKIVEEWFNDDILALMQQVTAEPAGAEG